MKAMRISVLLLALVISKDVTAAPTVHIVDGDTIEVSGVTYRLHGIDAPEAGQKCAKANGRTWQCGKAAIAALEALAHSGNVECDTRGTDSYSRVIGVCKVDGRDMGAAMVSSGNAWAFREYSKDYVAQENEARSASRGVWQAKTQKAKGLEGSGCGCGVVCRSLAASFRRYQIFAYPKVTHRGSWSCFSKVSAHVRSFVLW